jgi:hypothetical protein
MRRPWRFACDSKTANQADQAEAIADRVHLILNLSTAMERVLEERSRQLMLPPVEDSVTKPITPKASAKISPKHAAILVTRAADQMTEEQQQLFDWISVQCPDLIGLRQMALAFRSALAAGESGKLRQWIEGARRCEFGALVRFAYGLKKDLPAVCAAVETSWSTGQVEGQINRPQNDQAPDVRQAPASNFSALAYCRTRRRCRRDRHPELHQICGRAQFRIPKSDTRTGRPSEGGMQFRRVLCRRSMCNVWNEVITGIRMSWELATVVRQQRHKQMQSPRTARLTQAPV